MPNEKRITLKIDPAKHKEIKLKAVAEEVELSWLVRTLLDMWVHDKVKLPKTK